MPLYIHAYICTLLWFIPLHISAQKTHTLVMEHYVDWTLTVMVFLMFNLTVLINAVKWYAYAYSICIYVYIACTL